MKKEYSALKGKITHSGWHGDDEGLYKMPEFFREMQEMERGKARHVPPTKRINR